MTDGALFRRRLAEAGRGAGGADASATPFAMLCAPPSWRAAADEDAARWSLVLGLADAAGAVRLCLDRTILAPLIDAVGASAFDRIVVEADSAAPNGSGADEIPSAASLAARGRAILAEARRGAPGAAGAADAVAQRLGWPGSGGE